jgi:K+-sensing histidine kinase KdpD/DNA-binding response OmpR family regulator
MSKKKQLQHRLENLFNDLQIKEETPIPESSFQYNLPSWNWSSDEEGLYTKVSSQVTDCLGINNENFNGKSIFHYAITPQSGERLRNLFLKGIYPAEIDVYFQTAEGVFVPTRFQILSSPAHNGNKAGFYGFVQVLSENFVEPFITETPSNGNESNFQINDLINQVNQEFKEIGNIDFHHSTVPTTDAGLQAMKKNQLVSQAGSENHPAVIAIPVNMQEDGYGVLELIDYDPSRKWTEDDSMLVEEVAKQLSLAIENAQLYNAAQKELSERVKAQQEIVELNKDLASLNEFGQQLSRYTDSEDIFKLTKEMLDTIVDYHKLTIAFVNQNSKKLSFPLVFEDGKYIQVDDMDYTHQIPEEVFEKQITLNFSEDIENQIQQYGLFLLDKTPQTFLAIPMPVGKAIKGVIILMNYEKKHAFSPSDIDLITTIALQTASALENAGLFQEIRTALSSIESREKYQSNVALAVATLTKFGSNSIREVLDYLGLASESERIYFAQIREESVSPYWHQTVEWISPACKSSLRPHPVNNIPIALFNEWISQLQESGWVSIQKDDKLNEPLTKWMDGRETQSILLLAVHGKSSTPSIIAFENITSERTWRNEEIGFLRVAADALSNTYIREDLVDQLQVSLDETENLYNASHQLSLANSFEEMLQSITHGLYIPDINRGVLVLFESDNLFEVTHMQVYANWHNGNGTPPPFVNAEYDVAIYKEIFTPQMPSYYDDILNAGLSKNMVEIFKNQNIRSMAVLPLWSGKRRIGAVLLQSENKHTFTNREKRTFPPLIDQMATTVENLRLFGQTQEALNETEQLYKISGGISLAKNTQDLVDLVSQNILPASADRVALMMVRTSGADETPTSLEIVGYYNKKSIQNPQQDFFSINVFPALKALETAERLLIEDVHRDPLDEISKRTLIEMNIGGGIVLPLYSGERLVGILSVFSEKRFYISDDEYRMLKIAANGIAVAVERQLLLENTQQRALELQTAAEIARDTTSTLSLAELLNGIVKLISERFRFHHTAIYLVDEEKRFAEIQEATGEVGLALKQKQQKYAIGSKNIIGTVTASGEPLTIHDVRNNPLFDKSHLLPETESEIGLPLKIGTQVIGVLDIHSTRKNAFNQAEITVLQILTDQIAVAIENAKSYEISQQAIEDMREVDRIKSQFLANMSHELRTPLNSIIGFSRVILKGIDGPINDTQEQDLNAIYNSGQHLLRLINDILDLSKIEAGKMQLQMTESNVSDLVNSVMSTAIGLIKDKPIKLEYDIPEELPSIMVDQTRIRQVLLNFLSNAAKFTEKGQILVKANENISPSGEKEVMFTVTDSGPGIAEKDRIKLFMPFSQVDDSPTRKTGGTGLGLSICRSFIEMHNGRIGLLSSEVGKGSTFFFTIPLIEEETQDNPRQVLENSDSPHKAILAIDDDKQITSLYERFLTNHGYQVISLNESKKAVETAKKVKPFAITLDIMMPGRDGWQIIQELKNDPETKNIPVIICSILEEEEKGFNLGATDYLIKPFLQEDLLNAINRLNFDGQIHKILIIDDDEGDQRLIEKILNEHKNFDLTFAKDGDEGLNLLKSNLPDAVVLDLMMPGKDGFDVLDEIHSHKTFAHLPVIILTGADLSPEQYNRLTTSGQQLLLKGLLGEKELLTTLENTLRVSNQRIKEG